ncbi:extracellular solute-binding protein [Pseudokineococcus sp. 1T1Z-3]|uniref:extracellular solute-binding protein n=1 Tax=Pseudokineococcus sp. 1T1Z-3 TaxID=3132745 RepID=UPI003097ADBB
MATALPAAALAGTLLTACGSGDGGPPVVTWYVNNVEQESLAATCSAESDSYQIETVLLPAAASGQREQLLRRLAANDRTVDLMSLDPPFMAEFANAGFLRPFTDAEREELSEGVLDGPLEQSIFDDTMFSAPFYGNTQLLWYKRSVAEEAGLDMSQPVTWEQIIQAAEDTGTTVAAQGRRNESLTVWVNALVESDGGTILENGSEGLPADEVQPAIDSPAGARAAEVMRTLADSPAAPPALSTAGEEESRAAFQSDTGGFMVNWPYVWAAFAAAEDDGSLPADFREDVGWTRYPRVDPDVESATPLGGIGLSVGAFSENPDLALEALRCLRSPESQTAYMLAAGDPAASAAVYEDPEIQEVFPMYEQIRSGLEVAAPRPISPYYGDVTGVIQAGYHPPDELSPDVTPRATANLMLGVLSNQQLL